MIAKLVENSGANLEIWHNNMEESVLLYKYDANVFTKNSIGNLAVLRDPRMDFTSKTISKRKNKKGCLMQVILMM